MIRESLDIRLCRSDYIIKVMAAWTGLDWTLCHNKDDFEGVKVGLLAKFHAPHACFRW